MTPPTSTPEPTGEAKEILQALADAFSAEYPDTNEGWWDMARFAVEYLAAKGFEVRRSSLPTAAPAPVPEGQDEKAKGRLRDRLGGKPCDTYEQIDDAVADLVAHYTGVMARLYRHPAPATPLPGGDDLREARKALEAEAERLDVWKWLTPAEMDALAKAALSSPSPVPAAEDVREAAEDVRAAILHTNQIGQGWEIDGERAVMVTASELETLLDRILVPAPSNPQERK